MEQHPSLSWKKIVSDLTPSPVEVSPKSIKICNQCLRNYAITGEKDSRSGAEAEVEGGGDGGAQGQGRETGKMEKKREIQNKNLFSK